MQIDEIVNEWLNLEKKVYSDRKYKEVFNALAEKYVRGEELTNEQKEFVYLFVKTDEVIKGFLNGKNIRYIRTKKSDAEVVFRAISEKIMQQQELSENEKKYMDFYFKDYYLNIVGGTFNPFPVYEEKLKGIYKNLAEYYFANPPIDDFGAVRFTQLYYLADMCKDYEVKPRFYFEINNDFFTENEKAVAYYVPDEINKVTKKVEPVIYFNPSNSQVIKDECAFYTYIASGFHEFEHYLQNLQIKSEKLTNAQALLWGKEELVRKYLNIVSNGLGEKYYFANYNDHFVERDANYYGYNRLLSIGEKIDGEIPKLPNLIKFYVYDTSKKHEDVRNDDVCYAIDLLDEISFEALKKFGAQIFKWVPVLKNIYNNDLSKKTITQIESELQEECSKELNINNEGKQEIKEKYDKLLNEIAETDNNLLLQKKCIDLYYDTLYDNGVSFKSTVDEINDLIDRKKISYDDILLSINKRIKVLKNDKRVNKMDVYKELDLLVNLKMYINNIKVNKKFTLDISESLNTEDFLEERLYFIKKNMDDFGSKLVDTRRKGINANGDEKKELDNEGNDSFKQITLYANYRNLLETDIKNKKAIREIEQLISLLSAYAVVKVNGEEVYAPLLSGPQDFFLKQQEIYKKIEEAFTNNIISLKEKRSLYEKLENECAYLKDNPDFWTPKHSIEEISASRKAM